MTRAIFVIEGGFVLLAEDYTLAPVVLHPTPSTTLMYHLTGASVIRQWGTTAGLGQIALHGLQPGTIMDPCGNPEVPYGKVLMVLPCSY